MARRSSTNEIIHSESSLTPSLPRGVDLILRYMRETPWSICFDSRVPIHHISMHEYIRVVGVKSQGSCSCLSRCHVWCSGRSLYRVWWVCLPWDFACFSLLVKTEFTQVLVSLLVCRFVLWLESFTYGRCYYILPEASVDDTALTVLWLSLVHWRAGFISCPTRYLTLLDFPCCRVPK